MRNKNKNRIFRFNRRIRGKTNYSLRLKLLKSNMTRIVVRKFNSGVLIQFVDYDMKGDKILTAAKSMDLKKFGLTMNTGNLVSAYLTGYLAGKKALKAGLNSECIVDFGLQRANYGGRLYSAIKGVKDAGVNVRVSEVVFPNDERLSGEHLKADNVSKEFEKTKKAIEGMK